MSGHRFIAADVQSLNPDAIVTMYEIDLTGIPGFETEPVFRFTATKNTVGDWVVFGGKKYLPMPISVEGFESTGTGVSPRPRMRISNIVTRLGTGNFGLLAVIYDDLVGCKVRRIRTFAKYLDAVNFESGVNDTADDSVTFPIDEFWVEQKTDENPISVEFELTFVTDVEGVKLPRRQVIGNLCTHFEYRGDGCGYTGDLYYTIDDEPTTDKSKDACARLMRSCFLRHRKLETWTEAVQPDFAGYLEFAKSESALANPTLSFEGVWPDVWRALLGSSVGVRKTFLGGKVPFISMNFGNYTPNQTHSNMALFQRVTIPVANVAREATFSFFARAVAGVTLPADCSFEISFLLYGSAPSVGATSKLVLGSLTAAQLAKLDFYALPYLIPETFQANVDEVGEVAFTVTGLVPQIQLVVPQRYVSTYSEDENGYGSYSGGESVPVGVTIGLPVLSRRDPSWFGDFAFNQTTTKTGWKPQPMPFGGFVGAALISQ